ncbi:hypothetical protein VISI1226_12611 [Vibrio sinaloensis DSM 21326]|uniref:HTH araC/xylS-type domain-containing protein n=1 Tax=Vibrio sinaloensis DSM 21326 TaxID=945550 RepID=E8M2W9_PHOS4|nr:AraC family transcriptional regulator [Vibrio sinaloensis]EGA71627.1 hypothetical protein VISI1226_12611 [Vibrio sinaloensis DSM 21326]
MKRANRFSVSPIWKVLLSDMQIDPQAVLTYANLPADLLNRENATLTPQEYFQLCNGLEHAAGDVEVPLLFAQHLSVEAFDAPLFAAICSPDLNSALHRLSQYKPLIGPMLSEVSQGSDATTINIRCYGYQGELPKTLGLMETVFFTQLARLATREAIQPLNVTLQVLPDNISAYQDYFGCQIEKGPEVSIRFSAVDAQRKFLTSNLAMWEFFEAKLNQKLADLDGDASNSDRVRSVLFEILPAGQSSIEEVAAKLAISKRTLQRKLSHEGESFQALLQSVRAELADHYLEKSHMSLGEISFLLGFQESNSFIRAYSTWKGVSPGHYREQCH